jgi:hypothetical protein
VAARRALVRRSCLENEDAVDNAALSAFRRYEARPPSYFRRQALLLAEHLPTDGCQRLALARQYGLPTGA